MTRHSKARWLIGSFDNPFWSIAAYIHVVGRPVLWGQHDVMTMVFAELMHTSSGVLRNIKARSWDENP